jgi:carbonic anhydrase
MQRLLEGVHRFRTAEFGRYRDLFRRLSREGQKPHTLFITCADSRVLAELITQSKPGELFVVKNLGNIVPPASVTGSTNSTAAAIEFAVRVLEVSDVVVCGHSQCGAMHALMHGLGDGMPMPHVDEWLGIAGPVLEVVRRDYRHLHRPEEQLRALEEENVLFSLENLKSFPAVNERLNAGSLRLHAWFFKINTAELFAYDPEAKQFQPLPKPEHAAAGA